MNPSRPKNGSTPVRTLIGKLALSAMLLATACGGSTEPAAEADGADHGTLELTISWIKNVEFAGEYFADQHPAPAGGVRPPRR